MKLDKILLGGFPFYGDVWYRLAQGLVPKYFPEFWISQLNVMKSASELASANSAYRVVKLTFYFIKLVLTPIK